MDHFSHSPYWEHGGGPGPLGWAIFALLLAAVVLGVIALGAWFTSGRASRVALEASRPAEAADEALKALRLRYARGEIGRDDFLRASEDLGAGPPVPPAPA